MKLCTYYNINYIIKEEDGGRRTGEGERGKWGGGERRGLKERIRRKRDTGNGMRDMREERGI